MSKSLIGASLLFSEPNCPTREGELIKSLSDMENIPAPYLGMKVFVEDEGKCFFVSKLKAKVVDGVLVADAVVAELLPFGGDYTLPQATTETLGGVLLSKVIDDSNKVPTANAVKAELEKKQGVTKVVWGNVTNLSNMNDFTTAGAYNITGEHTRNDDNLPIANTGGGHTFNARLTVLDSSIERTEGEPQSDDKCITQLLNFNNRLGQGEVYIRTGKGRTLDSLTWDAWSTLQRNVNVGRVGNLDVFVDNGIYSGMDMNRMHTFVLIVINNYALASAMGNEKTITQLKYAAHLDTKIPASIKLRTKRGDDNWTNWENIGGNYTLPVATSTILGGVKVYETKGKVSSGPSGAEYSVNIRPDGTLYTTVDHADETHEGVVKVDSSVDSESNNPVSGKAVANAIANISGGGGGDITATPTEEVINDIEPTLVTDALRKTPQVLTDTEKEIARGNIGAVSYSDLSSAISNAIVNVLNTEV